MQKLFVILVAFSTLTLSGCVGAVMEGGSIAKDMATRASLEKSAAEGNAEAQYKLGETYCCRVGLKMGVYDNEQATRWMCEAALQGYGPAAYRLAEIYSGRPFTFRLMRRAINAVEDRPKNISVALFWARRAQADGYKDAASFVKKLQKNATLAERVHATRLQDEGAAPCRWSIVTGES